MAKAAGKKGDGKGPLVLTDKIPSSDLQATERDKINVEVGWTVKALSGEVDMDASCLVFNKWGRFVETIFWDNLSSEGIRHLGDEAIEANESEEEEDNAKEEEEKEVIEVDFSKLHKDITTLVFGMNIFSNKTLSSVTNISFTVAVQGNPDATVRYKIGAASLQKIKDYNALVLAKIYRTALEEPKWRVQVIARNLEADKSSAHSLPFGQLMDVVIPQLIHQRQVEALVPTWSKVRVQVVEGRGLAAEDLNGKSDPYVVVTAGAEDDPSFFKARTPYKKSTLTPKWDDQVFDVPYGKATTAIHFAVFDYDRIGRDEFLGQFSVNIAALPPNKDVARWFTLRSRKRDGEVGEEDLLGSLFIKLLKVAPTE